MAERLPDLAREHRLHDRFRGPPRASPVRFQVSRPADRTSRGWARGVPLAECRFPGPATRRLGRLRRESERSTQNGRAKTLWWWWQQLRITSGRLPRIWGSINYLSLGLPVSYRGRPRNTRGDIPGRAGTLFPKKQVGGNLSSRVCIPGPPPRVGDTVSPWRGPGIYRVKLARISTGVPGTRPR